MKNEHIQSRADKALQSFDGMQRAEANPFLYTRVMQQIENKRILPAAQNKWVPALACALLIFMSVNIYTFMHFQKTDVDTSTSKRGIEAFANEYGISETDNS